MDYKGYTDIDEDELDPNNPWDTKAAKKVKKIFKIIIYSISFIVYAAVFFVIFSSCEPGTFSKMFFTEQARLLAQQNPAAFKVYKLQPKDFMNYDGSIELAHIYYAKNAEELEVGVKFNHRKLTGGKIEDALVFILEDSYGNYHTSVQEVYDSNRKYGYARVAFSSVKLDLEQNSYFKYTESYDYASAFKANEDKNLKTASDGNGGEQNSGGAAYFLYIFTHDKIMSKSYASKDENGNIRIDFSAFKQDVQNNESGELSKHEIYNNNTVISLEEYQYE